MFFSKSREALNVARDEAKAVFSATRTTPSVLNIDNLGTFFGEMKYAFLLILEEKEIIVLAALQWLAIAGAYLLWTQMLDWIPDSVWQEVARASEEDRESAFSLIDFALLGWSFLVIAAVSYPLSVLNAAMVAVHYLRSSGQKSTIFAALGIAVQNMGRLWLFTVIDAWITVSAILDRLPKKRGRRTAVEEALYYAWKIGTAPVLPSLAAGNDFFEAAAQSVTILRKNTLRVIGVRMGYSLIAWVVGILAYGGALYVVMNSDMGPLDGPNGIFHFYVLMALPIFIAVGILNVLIRPFYMIMLARIYTEKFPYKAAPVAPAAGEHGARGLALFFAVFIVTFLAVTYMAEPLGITGWVESLAAKDLARIGQVP
ncbi:MAG: hypothetical protein EBQ96_09825 [Proteobacteria bacterium]|nr:hypothetical protein [Pseudomonadota bacterium]